MKGFEQIPFENKSNEVAPQKPASGKLKKLGKWLAGAAIVAGGVAGLEKKASAEDSAGSELPKTEKKAEIDRAQIEKALTTPILSGIDYDNLLTVDPSTITQTSLTKEFTQWIIEKNPAMAAKIADVISALQKNQSAENQKDFETLLAICGAFEGCPEKQKATTSLDKKTAEFKINQAIEERGGREAIEKAVIIKELGANTRYNYKDRWENLDPVKNIIYQISYTKEFLDYLQRTKDIAALREIRDEVKNGNVAGVGGTSLMNLCMQTYANENEGKPASEKRLMTTEEKQKLKKLMLELGK